MLVSRRRASFPLFVSFLLFGCAGAPTRIAPAPRGAAVPGVLVMAHGGTEEWNQAVGDAVEPIRHVIPTALALGMADPVTLQAALDSLERAGVTDVAVVRLFLSGDSFLAQTEYLFGLSDEAPAHPMMHGPHAAALTPLRHRARIVLSKAGLSASYQVSEIVADRVRASGAPTDAPILLIAHGMGADEENEAVLANMERAVEAVRASGYHDVHAATLREDWPEQRERSQAEMRTWVRGRTADSGRSAVVVPYRLTGFGPYADVLTGLDYVPTAGFLPHPLVNAWIREQARTLLCGRGFRTDLGPCATVAQEAKPPAQNSGPAGV